MINYALARSPTRWVNSAEPPMVGAPAAAAAMKAPSYLTNDFKKNKLDGASTSKRPSGRDGLKVCPFIHP